MAKFHALPIAMRLLKPQIFNEKIRPYLQRINLYKGIDKNDEICQVSVYILYKIKRLFTKKRRRKNEFKKKK